MKVDNAKVQAVEPARPCANGIGIALGFKCLKGLGFSVWKHPRLLPVVKSRTLHRQAETGEIVMRRVATRVATETTTEPQ
jgi:hypothetical protein